MSDFETDDLNVATLEPTDLDSIRDPEDGHGNTLTLANLVEGETAEVTGLELHDSHGRRLRNLGFVSGTKVRVVRKAPFGDPREYEVRGSRFCLRKTDADKIFARRILD